MTAARVTDGTANLKKTGVGGNLRRRVMWLVLVIFVPLLALAMMVAIALQVIGVPVLGTAMKMIHGTPAGAQAVSATQALQQQVLVEQAKWKGLLATNQALQQQLSDEKQKEQNMTVALAKAQTQLTQVASAAALAQQEAAVVKTMDPQAAALMLGKMSTQQAAGVIAVMSPTDSGPILSALSPSAAAQLLAVAAQIASQASLTGGASANATRNSAGGN